MSYLLLLSFMVCFLAFARASIDPTDVKYVFYTRQNVSGVIVHNAEDLSSTALREVFDPSLPTVVLVHGWKDNYEADSNSYVRSAVLNQYHSNVFKVDWSPISHLGYFSARDAVPSVGRLAAGLLKEISARYNYDLKRVTLVGFSLGAHVVGNIGKNLPGQISVIIALDPAGPFISSGDVHYSVHPSDAEYVQGIHTNGGTLGMSDPVGHSDFYPNGGSRQPGCGLDMIGGCAHNRAWEYFAESISTRRFVSTRCNSWRAFNAGRCIEHQTLMGGLSTIDKTAKGTYYLETNSKSPYARA